MSYDPTRAHLATFVDSRPRRPVRPPAPPAPRVLMVGIASPAATQARLMAIARGERRRAPNEPKVWFASMEAVSRIHTPENKALLAILREEKPANVKELAAKLDRAPSNVLRTLRTLERRGFVELHPAGGRSLRPEATFEVLVVVDDSGIERAAQGARAEAEPAH